MFWALLYLLTSFLAGMFLASAFKIFSLVERIFLGFSLGLFFSTILTFILTLLIADLKQASLLTLEIETVLIFVFLYKNKNKLKNFILNPKLTFWPFFVVLLFYTCLFYRHLDFQTLVVKEDGFYVGGANFGDLPMHLAYTTSFVYGANFPPQNPFFAGERLVYQFFPDFLSAALISLSLSLRISLILPSMIFFISLFGLCFFFMRSFFDKKAALAGTIVFFSGWNLGHFYFLREIYLNRLPLWQSLFFPRQHTTWDFNIHFYSPMANLFAPERSFLPGLILGLLLAVMMWRILNEKKHFRPVNFILSGLLLGILPFWHFHTFISAVFIYICWFFLFVVKKYRFYLSSWLLLGLTALVLVLPGFLWSWQQVKPTTFLSWHLFWTKGQENLIWYWFKNGGLVLFSAPLAFFWLKVNKKFFLPVFLLFGLANMVSFQPWEWDNIKIFVFCFWFFSALFAYLLTDFEKKKWLGRISGIIFVLAIGYFPLAYVLETSSAYRLYSQNDFSFSSWLIKNTDTHAVFAVSPAHNHPVSTLAGRRTFMGYPGFLWVHGIDYQKREKTLKFIFRGGEEGIKKARENQIDYVVFNENDKLEYPQGYNFYKDYFSLIYGEKGYSVFVLK